MRTRMFAVLVAVGLCVGCNPDGVCDLPARPDPDKARLSPEQQGLKLQYRDEAECAWMSKKLCTETYQGSFVDFDPDTGGGRERRATDTCNRRGFSLPAVGPAHWRRWPGR